MAAIGSKSTGEHTVSYSTTEFLIFGLVGLAIISGLFLLGRWMSDQESEGIKIGGRVIEFVVCSILAVVFLAMVGQMGARIDPSK